MSTTDCWHGKPYYSLDSYCKNTFHEKLYKIALDAHMTCPNRDGTLGQRGCIFCSAGGSGDFAVNTAGKSIDDQLTEGIQLFHTKKIGTGFIAYFQAYTNTYGPMEYLHRIFTQALLHPMIRGISIATRPDCLGQEVLQLLCKLQADFPDKFLWIELGLQTIHESSARLIRRGYPLSCFAESYERLKECSIPVIVHTILGLPKETREDMFETITYLSRLQPFGVKLQLLHVLKGTDLAALYETGAFDTLSKEEYLSILIHCLELLPSNTVIHRVTGDGPKDLTLAPRWSLHKKDVLNSLHRQMQEQHTFQGRLYQPR